MGALLSGALLGGCAAPPGGGPAGGAGRSDGDAGAAARPTESTTAQYLKVQAAQTGVMRAADDGRHVYAWFNGAAPESLRAFDQDGRPLPTAQAGNVVAIWGVHRGVLLRTATGDSYLAPNPRADTTGRVSRDDDPLVVEARQRLEGETTQMRAFRRALARAGSSGADATEADSRATPVAVDDPQRASASPARAAPIGHTDETRTAPSPMTPPSALAQVATTARIAPGGSPGAAYASPTAVSVIGAPNSPMAAPPTSFGLHGPPPGPPPSVPAAAAVATAATATVATSRGSPPDELTYLRLADGSSMVRLFFASGSRAIVRPDDGLAHLEQEARGADEIRITGFTDSVGSLSSNLLLAQSRAEAVRQLIVRRGIAPEKTSVGAVPAARFLAENTTEQGRALNRRVEVLMLRGASR